MSMTEGFYLPGSWLDLNEKINEDVISVRIGAKKKFQNYMKLKKVI